MQLFVKLNSFKQRHEMFDDKNSVFELYIYIRFSFIID